MTEPVPLVSVVVPSYNHARFIDACLDSVAAQTFRDFEVVFIDDCSSDDSVAVATARLADLDVPVRIVTHPVNLGICGTFSDGVHQSRGPYLAFLAADDTWYPTRLAEHVEAFARADPSVGVVYSDADVIDEQGERIGASFIQTQIGDRRPEGDLFFDLLDDSFLIPNTATVRRAVYRTVGVYDDRLDVEDHDFFLRVTNSFTFAYHPHTVGSYRIVATSLSQTLDWRPRLVTRARTYGKFTGQPGERGAAARRKQYEALANLYLISPAAARGPAIRAALARPSRRVVGLAALATLGIPYRVAKPIGRRVLSI